MPEKFSLKNFEGPLDLLLLLVQKDELQIIEIAIHLLTQQLLQHFHEERVIDKRADQMTILAQLLVLKSRTLVPHFEEQDTAHLLDIDERFTLIEQLLDHCQFKEIAESLQEKERQALTHFTRMIPLVEEEKSLPTDLGLAEVTLEELKKLFKKVYENAKNAPDHVIQGHKWGIKEKINLLSALLTQQKELSFAILFEKTSCKEELVVTFLALLELIKQGKILVILDHHELKFTGKRDHQK